MFRKRKIPCYVTIFDQFEVIKKRLDFLTAYADRLDFVVVENASEHTSTIQKYVQSLGKKRLIKRYYFFEKNITTNAVATVLNKEIRLIEQSPLIMTTDGDLTCDDPHWLDEEIAIMKRHPELFACGVTLDKSNLPIKAFPEAIHWIPPDISEADDYYEAPTGGHLLMMRGRDYGSFLRWGQENNMKGAVDSDQFKYAYNVLHKKWARTKHVQAYHLTWDLYADTNHPYTKLRMKKTFQETWNHTETSPYTCTSYE